MIEPGWEVGMGDICLLGGQGAIAAGVAWTGSGTDLEGKGFPAASSDISRLLLLPLHWDLGGSTHSFPPKQKLLISGIDISTSHSNTFLHPS